MLARHIRKTQAAVPFNVAESQLRLELEIYFEAIHSYPDHFARTGVSFQRHLLNVICAASGQGQSSEPLKSAS